MHTAQTTPSSGSRARTRKVTYNLPAALVDELDQRTAAMAQNKSAVVCEALELYFAEQNRYELAAIYAEAAEDPLFRADNEAVLQDFTALDPEWDTDETP